MKRNTTVIINKWCGPDAVLYNSYRITSYGLNDGLNSADVPLSNKQTNRQE